VRVAVSTAYNAIVILVASPVTMATPFKMELVLIPL
jgi:hypothetical protein